VEKWKMITITGSVGANGKSLVTGMLVQTTSNALLKITFENNTAGTNLELNAGTFGESTPQIRLSSSGGPGYQFLTIIDAKTLAGKDIYVRRAVGTATSKFTINIE
jgi:hypothetical protein